MKVQGLNEPLVTSLGTNLVGADSKPLTAKPQIIMALQSYSSDIQGDMVRAMAIAKTVSESNGSCVLESEDVTIIKAACAGVDNIGAGMFCAILDLVEGKASE